MGTGTNQSKSHRPWVRNESDCTNKPERITARGKKTKNNQGELATLESTRPPQ
jgi:hypothetical protein